VKLLLTNIELETTPQKSKFYATYNNNGFYYLKDFKLDPNFNYKTLPEVAKISTSEQYQIGDIVETSWRFNEFTEIEIKNGIIVSQDGNNLYVYFEDENGKSQHFAWRYISDIRSIGSSKKLEFETFTQVDISKLQAYQQALNCSSKFPVNWDFLWYYRHDIQGLKTRLSSESLSFLNPENLSDLLVYYECMYQTIKNYPDIGGTGNTINNRFDVQYQFLSNYKSIIKSAFESRINARINAFQSDIKTGFYTYECARNDGQILLENQLKKELTPFESGYLLLNGKITVPSISAAYQEGVSLFTSNLKEIDGLQLDNHLYEGKDARVEQLCINRLKKWCPYATKIMSGCYNNEFLIEYNSLGTPIYRTKSVVLVFESATFRCKVKAHYTIREEFINGKYTDVSFPRDGSLYYYR
jgi:hypothetical protein